MFHDVKERGAAAPVASLSGTGGEHCGSWATGEV